MSVRNPTGEGRRGAKPQRVEITSTLHVSNTCSLKRKCHYCGFAAKTSPEGYYKSVAKPDRLMEEIALTVYESGIRRISISAGYGNFDRVLRAVEIVKENTDLEVLVNVGGDLSKGDIKILKTLGVETVCCNLETVNEKLFKKLKPDDDLKQRLNVCRWVKEEGMWLSSGLLLGIGESEKDREEHLRVLKELEVDEIPVMGFRPYKGTPMENHPPAPLELSVQIVNRIREEFPNLKRITVPFPIYGYEGLPALLEAGANNVATVVPRNYPTLIKGVGTPKVGILEELVPFLEKLGYRTNVKKSLREQTLHLHP